MENVNEHLEMFMIPRLINNLEESTGSNVIWINDAVNIAQYKTIDKVIFLGLHPVSKVPYLLNYAANPTNVELNFEITTVWGLVRDWIYKEKISLDSAGLNDKICGNYILQFNPKSELVYINEYSKPDLDQYFVFPAKIERQADLSLQSILRRKVLFEQVSGLVASLVEFREKEADISKPEVDIRVVLDEKGRLKSFFMVFKSRALLEARMSDPFADFEYAITPLSVIRNTEQADDSAGENNHSVFSNKESTYSGFRRNTIIAKAGHNKPSNFGTKKVLEGQNQLGQAKRGSLKGDQVFPERLALKNTTSRASNNFLVKQSSRFTNEGSVFSDHAMFNQGNDGPKSFNLSAVKSAANNPASPNEDDSDTRYRMIENRVNKSIVMEYMQGNQMRVGGD